MKQKTIRKILRYIIIVGSASFVTLIGIAYDAIENQREELPWPTTPLLVAAGASLIVGVGLIIKLLWPKNRKKRY